MRDDQPAEMHGQEVRRRAAAGAVLLGARGVALRVIGLLSNIVIARILSPEDFGTVAFGLSVMVFITFLASGGIGAGMVRDPDPPGEDALRTLVGIQLVGGTVLAGLVIAIAALYGGEVAQVTAVIVCTVPLVAFRTPGSVALQRALEYRRLAAIEVAENLAYNAWAVGAVVLGFGVYGLATASIVRIVFGTALMVAAGPVGALRPRLGLARVRGLLAFGMRYQAVGVANLGRDQGLNMVVAAVGSVSTLGLWAIAKRVMEVPFLLFDSLMRVSFPAMARLRAGGEDLRPVVERGVRVGAVMTGVLLVPLAASAPALVPVVFGDDWREAAEVIPPACFALQISGAVPVATAGFLFSAGAAGRVLFTTVSAGITWLTATALLLSPLGVRAVGVGWIAGATVDATLLARATRERCGARLAGPVLVTLAIATPSAALGLLIADQGETLWHAILAAAVSLTVFLGVHVLLRRAVLLDVRRLGSVAFAGMRRSL